MKRVLVVTDDCSGGGTAQVAKRLAVGLQNDFEIHLALPLDRCPAHYAREIADQVRHLHQFGHAYDDLATSTHDLKSCVDLLARIRPDLVLICGSIMLSSNLALKITASRIALPYLIIVNSYYDSPLKGTEPPLRPIIERTSAAAGAVVFVADRARMRCAQDFGPLNSRFLTVNNCAPDTFFAPVMADIRDGARRELGVPADALLLVVIGRIQPEKGQSLCLAALAQIKDPKLRARIYLLFVGASIDGHATALKAEALSKGLASNIVIHSETSDILPLLSASDALVLASFSEGSPLAIREAMALSKPVIASDVGDIGQFLSCENGYLLPDPNVSAEACVSELSLAMAALAGDAKHIARMGRTSRAIALDHFTSDRFIERYRGLIKDILAGHPDEPQWEGLSDIFPSIDIGWHMTFSDPRICNVLGENWSRPDAGGRWMIGNACTLRLPLAAGARRCRLNFDIGIVDGAVAQNPEADIFVNGEFATSWKASPTSRNPFPVDLAVPPDTKEARIDFRVRNTASLKDLGVCDSDRALSFIVKRLAVAPAR